MSLQRTTLAASLVAGSALLSPGPAYAASTVAFGNASPVAITSCNVEARYDAVRGYAIPAIEYATVDALRISFQNRRDVAANEVDLEVAYGGHEATVVDSGSFAPATSVAHAFATFSGEAYAGAAPVRCDVVAVRYADGSVWHPNGSNAVAQTRNVR